MDLNLRQEMALFRNLDEEEMEEALTELATFEKNYQKGETILQEGMTTQCMGLVLEGSIIIESNDLWGKRTILSHVGRGGFFAETYALLGNEPMLVSVTANEESRILFLHLDRLLDRLSFKSRWTVQFMANLLTIFAHKNLTLSSRNFHISPKTIRERVVAYLHSLSIQKGTREFDIPFDRQQLADYLNLDRTALSKELGKMQKEGLLLVKKNHFTIVDTQKT